MDIILQGHATHLVSGWSVHLLGALWTSVTHFLVYAVRPPANSNDIEMGNPPTVQESHSKHEAPESTTIQTESSSSTNKQFFQLT